MIKQIHPTVRYPLRSPQESVASYDNRFKRYAGERALELQAMLDHEADTLEEWRKHKIASSICEDFMKRARLMHGRGDPLNEIQAILISDLQHALMLKHQGYGGLIPRLLYRDRFDYFAIVFLLLPEQTQLKDLLSFTMLEPNERFYMAEVIIKAFVPDWQMANKYTRKHDIAMQLPWSDPILRILGMPAEARAAACAKHMQDWERIMKPWLPYNWEPTTEHTGKINSDVHVDFAFEVALAVCAYDIDDSSFRDHRYYPRDLVDYYRANLRYTRDAWRAEGVGAGIAIDVPPPPQRVDLAKSKRKGYARWVELISDGNKDATESVLEVTGKLRKIKDLFEVSTALAEADIAIHADIKDDDTLENQLEALIHDRKLTGYIPIQEPEAGVARCEALLTQAKGWFSTTAYRLIPLPLDEDAWSAVIIKADYVSEFKTLSQDLGLVLSE
jgi:hypothetical protein